MISCRDHNLRIIAHKLSSFAQGQAILRYGTQDKIVVVFERVREVTEGVRASRHGLYSYGTVAAQSRAGGFHGRAISLHCLPNDFCIVLQLSTCESQRIAILRYGHHRHLLAAGAKILADAEVSTTGTVSRRVYQAASPGGLGSFSIVAHLYFVTALPLGAAATIPAEQVPQAVAVDAK